MGLFCRPSAICRLDASAAFGNADMIFADLLRSRFLRHFLDPFRKAFFNLPSHSFHAFGRQQFLPNRLQDLCFDHVSADTDVIVTSATDIT